MYPPVSTIHTLTLVFALFTLLVECSQYLEAAWQLLGSRALRHRQDRDRIAMPHIGR